MSFDLTVSFGNILTIVTILFSMWLYMRGRHGENVKKIDEVETLVHRHLGEVGGRSISARLDVLENEIKTISRDVGELRSWWTALLGRGRKE